MQHRHLRRCSSQIMSQTQPEPTETPSAGAEWARTARRRRRRYVPGLSAAPDRAEEAFAPQDWRALHSYRNGAAIERRTNLSGRMRVSLPALLHELEEYARERGIPAALMNRPRIALDRGPGKPIALTFGHDVDLGTGELVDRLPPLTRSRPKKPSTPATSDPPDDLGFLLARSVQLARDSRADSAE